MLRHLYVLSCGVHTSEMDVALIPTCDVAVCFAACHGDLAGNRFQQMRRVAILVCRGEARLHWRAGCLLRNPQLVVHPSGLSLVGEAAVQYGKTVQLVATAKVAFAGVLLWKWGGLLPLPLLHCFRDGSGSLAILVVAVGVQPFLFVCALCPFPLECRLMVCSVRM